MFKAYKFRLWTSPNQERELSIALETHRRLYNLALAQRRWFYEEWQVSRSYWDQSGWFKDERGTNQWFARINFSSPAMWTSPSKRGTSFPLSGSTSV
jgi:putative transposase